MAKTEDGLQVLLAAKSLFTGVSTEWNIVFPQTLVALVFLIFVFFFLPALQKTGSNDQRQ